MENFWKKQRDELKDARGRKVSQYRLAVALDLTPAVVGFWERDELAPNLKMAAKLARVYEVSQDRIEAEIVAQTRRIVAAKQAEAKKEAAARKRNAAAVA